jgi:hypothetical protein
MKRKYIYIPKNGASILNKGASTGGSDDGHSIPPWLGGVLETVRNKELREVLKEALKDEVVAQELGRMVMRKETGLFQRQIYQVQQAAEHVWTYGIDSEREEEVMYVGTWLVGIGVVMKPQIVNGNCTPREQLNTIVRPALNRLDCQAYGHLWLLRHALDWGLEDEVDLVRGLKQMRYGIKQALIFARIKCLDDDLNGRLK